jgi:hypothetical protein
MACGAVEGQAVIGGRTVGKGASGEWRVGMCCWCCCQRERRARSSALLNRSQNTAGKRPRQMDSNAASLGEDVRKHTEAHNFLFRVLTGGGGQLRHGK